MDSQASHMLIFAVETAYNAAEGQPDPKATFIEVFTQAVDELLREKRIDETEHRDIMNSREQIWNAANQQVLDPTPNDTLKGLRTSVQMFGPQFVIDSDVKDTIISQLGPFPIWAVISTFAADTMYSGLTYPEALHRAQIEALEVGREASVVLQIQHFQGPPLMGLG
jgi:hypothetical protein